MGDEADAQAATEAPIKEQAVRRDLDAESVEVKLRKGEEAVSLHYSRPSQ